MKTARTLKSNGPRCQAYRRKLRRRARRILAGAGLIQCLACQATRGLEMAHLEPTGLSGRGRGWERRYLDAIRNPNSYVLLCRACHVAYDNPSPGNEGINE